jgi:hypothetical protein
MANFRLDYDFLKHRYDAELARKDKLTDQLGTPVTVLIALIGAAIAMMQGLSHANRTVTGWFFGFIVVGAVSAVRSLPFFAKAYHGQTYSQLPKVEDIYAVLQKYVAYYEEQGYRADEALKEAEREFEDNLRFNFTQAIDQNLTSNNNRLEFMHEAIIWLFVLIASVGLSSIPYAIDRIIAPVKPSYTRTTSTLHRRRN